MTKQELAQKLVDIYTNSGTIVTASLGVFTFTYGEYAVDVYTPTELMEAAHAINPNVKIRYGAELNAAFAMYRYFKNNPNLFALGRQSFTKTKNVKLNVPYQLITYGAPGTGKSWSVKQETQGRSCIRTTFHPDSDYSTFIGAYKPSMEADDYETIVTAGEKSPSGTIIKKDGLVRQKRIVYKFVAQAFLEAYVEAWRKWAAFLSAQDDEPRGKAVQFLVIEEINRGNCAQIFGDIFQLLDREDDGYSSYAIKADNDLRQYLAGAFGGADPLDLSGVNLADHDVTPDEIRNGVKMLLPPNLFIRATMNTSDQSLFPIDSAFKRRWDWKYMPITDEKKGWKIRVETPAAGGSASGAGGEGATAPANDGGEGTAATGTADASGATVTEYDWWKFLDTINGLISGATKSEDKQLGYYFARPDKGGTAISAAKFVNKVLFYLYNDVFKDYDLPPKFAKPDGGKFAFKDFFLADGEPNEAAVKVFLDKLLGNS